MRWRLRGLRSSCVMTISGWAATAAATCWHQESRTYCNESDAESQPNCPPEGAWDCYGGSSGAQSAQIVDGADLGESGYE